MEAKALETHSYLSQSEIASHLNGLSHIVMVAPAPEHFEETPLHFTLFLNTQELLSKEIQQAIFEKFLTEQQITNPQEIMSELMPVGFGNTTQQTPMPLLLIKPQERASIPHIPMFVMDFLADSTHFSEAKTKSLTGWSYIYEE